MTNVEKIMNIKKEIEANRRTMYALECRLSTASSAQADWICEQIDELAARNRELEMELAKL